MMLGSTPDLPPGPATYLDPVQQVLGRGAQIVFGNLEGTLTTATASKCGPGGAAANCYAFRDPPAYVRYVKDAGFTILNDANNHSMDFGPACEAQTVRTIRAAGLAQTGGNAAAFVARMSQEDFGSSAARISPSGVIQPP